MLDRISIIMPVRNGIPYLKECLDSIIGQSYTNWQLHVVNDHSTDDTLSVLHQYENLDSRIIPTQNKGKGIIDALTTGYNLSIGQYITRMDADDIMPPDKLETLICLLGDQETISVATGQVQYFSSTGVKDGYKSYENWLNQLCIDNNHFDHIYKECVIASPAWMMKRDHFDLIGGFKSDTYPEDYDLCFRMYEQGAQVISTNNSIHLWRDHSSRTSRNDQNYADNRFLALKLEYFRKIEIQKHDYFMLLGAGKKGKSIAKYLIDHNIAFTWVTNNKKKIGINIYEIILEDYEEVDLSPKGTALIISVANKDEQAEINQRISNKSKEEVYFFC